MKDVGKILLGWPSLGLFLLGCMVQASLGDGTRMAGRTPAERGGVAAYEVRFTTLEKGVNSGIRERAELVIETEQAWKEVWSRHEEGVVPAQKLPAVDFSRQMIIAVFMGEQRTGGFTIEIQKMQEKEGGLEVFVQETSPLPGSVVTQVLTQPHDIVTVATKELPVRFRHRSLRQ